VRFIIILEVLKYLIVILFTCTTLTCVAQVNFVRNPDEEQLNFYNKEAVLKLKIPGGSYILELKDEAGNVQRERIVIESNQ